MEVIAAVISFKDTGRRINQVLTEEYFTKHNIKTKLKQKVKSILFNQAGRLGWRDLLVYLKLPIKVID